MVEKDTYTHVEDTYTYSRNVTLKNRRKIYTE